MNPLSPDDIAAALRDNDAAPLGRARAARAEQLVEAAAQTGDRPLTIRALQDLIQAYEFGGEGDKSLVPFARTLRMWDENPGDFDERTTHSLFWHFKWITGGMISHPNVPLATIREWLDEMGRRYAEHGHGTRAVHAQRYFVEEHIGNAEAAQAAFNAWIATDRDRMADCHACELNGQGHWHALNERYGEAIALWQPVLDGRLSCAEEPHRVLSKSLLPLLHLGRPGAARDNHLRGYRMARGNPNLRSAVARHIEFAALTGNEARGLEMLAEHVAWLTPADESPVDRLAFLEATALLLRRLRAAGRGDVPVPTGRGGTATVDDLLPRMEDELFAIAARYDARNGTSEVSDRARARLDQAALADYLPLGTRAEPLPDRPAPAPVATGTSLDELVAAAEALTLAHHLDAHQAWERVAQRGPVEAWVRARITESRAVKQAEDHHADPEAVRAGFLNAAEEYAALGDAGRSLANRARAALASGAEPDEWERMFAEAERLAQTGTPAADLSVVWQCRAWTLQRDPEGADDPVELERVLDKLEALAEGSTYRAAIAAFNRAQWLDEQGRSAEAVEKLEAAAEGFIAAEVPWRAALPLLALSGHSFAAGDNEAAERYARAGLAHAGSQPPQLSGQLAATVARACANRPDGTEDEIDHALLAAGRFDEAGEEFAPLAARARLLAGESMLRAGRAPAAVAVLETALPELVAHGDADDVVRARAVLGRALVNSGEPRAAAEAFLEAAAGTIDWPDQTAHASLAHDAGDALERAGLIDEAERAYGRAAELWSAVGNIALQVRATRAVAWVRTRTDEPDWLEATALLESAHDLLADATDPELRYEDAETQRQLAQMLYNRAEDDPDATIAERAATMADTAAAAFTELGETGRANAARFLAVDVEYELLDRPEAAKARLIALREAAAGDDSVVQRCDAYLRHLAQ